MEFNEAQFIHSSTMTDITTSVGDCHCHCHVTCLPQVNITAPPNSTTTTTLGPGQHSALAQHQETHTALCHGWPNRQATCSSTVGLARSAPKHRPPARAYQHRPPKPQDAHPRSPRRPLDIASSAAAQNGSSSQGASNGSQDAGGVPRQCGGSSERKAGRCGKQDGWVRRNKI